VGGAGRGSGRPHGRLPGLAVWVPGEGSGEVWATGALGLRWELPPAHPLTARGTLPLSPGVLVPLPHEPGLRAAALAGGRLLRGFSLQAVHGLGETQRPWCPFPASVARLLLGASSGTMTGFVRVSERPTPTPGREVLRGPQLVVGGGPVMQKRPQWAGREDPRAHPPGPPGV
jgi:hypothetical protein